MNRRSQRRETLTDFFFYKDSDQWLAILRIGLGALVVLYALSLLNDWHYLFATSGEAVVTRDFAEALLFLQTRFVPTLGWLVRAGESLGLREGLVLSATWVCLISVGIGLLLGVFCRVSAIIAWFLHLCAAKSGAFVTYGVDDFMTIGLFYLMLSPLPDQYSFDRLLRKTTSQNSGTLGFFRRVLQLHLCLIYFFGGLTKFLGSDWWNGLNLWRALTRPPFDVIPAEILVRWKLIFPVAGVTICLLEMGYPFFIWLKKTRSVWLIAVLLMHAAIGIMMGMYLFALVMIVLNLAAFGPDTFLFRKRGEPTSQFHPKLINVDV